MCLTRTGEQKRGFSTSEVLHALYNLIKFDNYLNGIAIFADVYTQRYIFSNQTKLEALAIALKTHNRRKLMEALKIGVLYDAEVTCVGLQGAKAEMITPREGCQLPFSWNKAVTSVLVH